jgi:pimeloyl-ACP methyl ester carboxylesterase
MGGMLFYAFSGSSPSSSAIASAVTLGSPVRFYHPRLLERFGVRFYPYLQIFRYLNLRKIIPFLFFFLARSPRVRVFYNPENVRLDLIRWAGRYALGTLAVTELYQFARWIVEHHLRSLDNRWDYREGIRKISVPTLVIAGAGDLLCPPYTVRPAFELLSAPAKSYVEAGVAQGFSRDYGHIDLVFGTDARREIFPLVADWIRRNSIEKTQRLALSL